jgi:hypothetical protein
MERFRRFPSLPEVKAPEVLKNLAFFIAFYRE